MPKQTRLDDSASIYDREERNKSQKQLWREMDKHEKITHFKTYYLSKLIAIVAVAALVTSLVVTMLTPKPDILIFGAVIDGALTSQMKEQVETGFAGYIGMDPETQELYFDDSFYLTTAKDYTLQQKLVTYIAAGQLDVIIGSEEYIRSQAETGCLTPLSEQLPPELYTALKDYFIYGKEAITDELANVTGYKEEKVYGLRLDECAIYEGAELKKIPAIGIVVTSQSKDYAVEFIKYLFGK